MNDLNNQQKSIKKNLDGSEWVMFCLKKFEQIDKEIRTNETNIKKVLDCYKTTNKKLTIIISNCRWFKFNLIKKYFSFFNFIIITNSLTYIGLNSTELEYCVAIQNYKNDWYGNIRFGKINFIRWKGIEFNI